MTAAGRPTDLPDAPAIPGLVARHVDRDRDFEPIAALIGAANVHDGVQWQPTADDLRHEWGLNDGADLDEDVLLAEVDGVLAGVAAHDWRLRGERIFHELNVVVRPEFRRHGLGRAMLARIEERVASAMAAGEAGGSTGREHVFAGWADIEITAVEPWAAAAGYTIDGYGILMRRSLADPIPEVALPNGLEIRPVEEADHRRIWDADVEAFQDHRDPAVRTENDFRHWFTIPDLDTSLWQVAWDGGEVAGSVMNVVFAEENRKLGLSRGWLEHVSVRRPWRKRGLASALIARSLVILRDLGLQEAALGADAENLSGAVRLYEALGFRRMRTSARYRKPVVPPGGGAVELDSALSGHSPVDSVNDDAGEHS